MKTLFLCALLVSVCFADSIQIDKKIEKVEIYSGTFGKTSITIRVVNGKIQRSYMQSETDGMFVDTSFCRLLIDKVFEPKEPEKISNEKWQEILEKASKKAKEETDSIITTPWGIIRFVPDGVKLGVGAK